MAHTRKPRQKKNKAERGYFEKFYEGTVSVFGFATSSTIATPFSNSPSGAPGAAPERSGSLGPQPGDMENRGTHYAGFPTPTDAEPPLRSGVWGGIADLDQSGLVRGDSLTGRGYYYKNSSTSPIRNSWIPDSPGPWGSISVRESSLFYGARQLREEP